MLLILGAALSSCSVGRAAMIGRTSLARIFFLEVSQKFWNILVMTSPGCKYAFWEQIGGAGSITWAVACAEACKLVTKAKHQGPSVWTIW